MPPRQSAPDYTRPFLVSMFCVFFVALFAIWAIWGLVAACVTGWFTDRFLARVPRRG